MLDELSCRRVRVDLSAALDGELSAAERDRLEAHLASCPDCRSHQQELAEVRRQVRLQPAIPVPDLTQMVLHRVAEEEERRRRERVPVLRIAVAAAVITILVLRGLPLPRVTENVASAGEIAVAVRAAAREVKAYRATFQIIERGWHPDVPLRRFTATIDYTAPEQVHLRVRDQTTYPAGEGWPSNDVELIAGPERAWIGEPATCPPAALPGCEVPDTRIQRTLVNRQPFDGTTLVPTDIIVPLETLASTGSFDVVGRGSVMGRDAHIVSLPYREAAPLVEAFQSGGSWRAFAPFDQTRVWIDADTWFPLRFEVTPQGGERALSVEAIDLDESPNFAPGTFRAPVRGTISDGRFVRAPLADGDLAMPDHVAGLDAYRVGTAGGAVIASFASGTTWLKVTVSKGTVPSGALEERKLPAGGYGYYLPAADAAGRRLDVYDGRRRYRLESNLAREELMKVAASLGVEGDRVDRGEIRIELDTLRRVQTGKSLQAIATPARLPEGYAARAATASDRGGAPTITVYYRHPEVEHDGFGIRITESRGVSSLQSSSEEFTSVEVDGVVGRWSAERGELEWIDAGTYRAVAAPSFGLGTALAIAESLR